MLAFLRPSDWFWLIVTVLFLLAVGIFGFMEHMTTVSFAGAQVQTLCFSPDGRILYGVGSNNKGKLYGSIWAWDVATGRLLWHHKTEFALDVLELYPVGSSLLAMSRRDSIYEGSRGEATLRNLETGEQIALLTDSRNNATTSNAYFTPDGQRILGCFPEGIQVWDAQTGAHLDFWILPDDRSGQPLSLSFSADGSRMLVQIIHTSNKESLVQLWDTRAGKPIREARTGKPLRDFPLPQSSAYALSSNGEQVAILSHYLPSKRGQLEKNSSPSWIELWSAEGELLRQLTELPVYIYPIALSFQPDGNLLYKGYYFSEREPTTIRSFFWDVNNDQITEQTIDDEIAFSHSPDGELKVSKSPLKDSYFRPLLGNIYRVDTDEKLSDLEARIRR